MMMNLRQLIKQKVFPFNLFNKQKYPPCHNCITLPICKGKIVSYNSTITEDQLKVTIYNRGGYTFFHVFLIANAIKRELLPRCELIKDYLKDKGGKTTMEMSTKIMDYYGIPKSAEIK